MDFARQEKEVARRDWLKAEGLGTNYAWWIAERAEGRGWEDDDPKAYLKAAVGYVEKMYAGSKAALKPIHDALIQLGLSIADDVKICPCQTIVPLYREHVFAEIKPATQRRIDLGFALGNMKATGRLIDTGGFARKNRITHRIPIESIDQIDDEVEHWLRMAYEMDAPKAATNKGIARSKPIASATKTPSKKTAKKALALGKPIAKRLSPTCRKR
ncbi:MAG: hypothetical protein IPK83_15430 [Planctomycetes bacterium]|nr:hypothetical protein [Planctomycetota bacterium]